MEASPQEREESVGELRAIPTWGSGAFMAITRHGANSVIPTDYSMAEIWMPHQFLAISIPGSTSEVEEVATSIGDAAAE